MPSIHNGIGMTADVKEYISTCRESAKQPNLPVKPESQSTRNQVEPGSRAGMPNMWVNTHGIAVHTNTAKHVQKIISTGQQTQNRRLIYWECNAARRRVGRTRDPREHAKLRRQEHGDANSSRGAINVLVTPDLPVRSAKPHTMGEPEMPRYKMDALDTCAHMKSDADNLKRPAKMSAALGLPATGHRCRTAREQARMARKPNGHVEHVYTHTQRIVNDSRKLTDKLKHVRIPQNGCIKPNSPGRSPESRREESHRPGNDTDTSHARPERWNRPENGCKYPRGRQHCP